MWREFIQLAEKREEPFAALCARFGVSRKTGYKWLNRYRTDGEMGLRQQSRRPKSSPRRTPDTVVNAVFAVRRSQPDWSVARIHRELEDQGVNPLPAPSTIDLILRRRREAYDAQQQALGSEARRFEPNFRWIVRRGAEMSLADGGVVTPVFVRDEITGFIVGAAVSKGRDDGLMRDFATSLFQRHGLPWRMTVGRDEASQSGPACQAHTPFTVWLMQLGVAVEFAYGPPAEELTEATNARRQLTARLASLPAYQRTSLTERTAAADPLEQFAQAAAQLTVGKASALLEQLREQHNFGGKQEAMQRRSPISIFRASPRLFPDVVAEPAYAPEANVRLVSEKGIFTFQRRLAHVGRSFAGLCVELKLTPHPDRFIVLFAGQVLGLLDISVAPEDGTTSLHLSGM